MMIGQQLIRLAVEVETGARGGGPDQVLMRSNVTLGALLDLEAGAETSGQVVGRRRLDGNVVLPVRIGAGSRATIGSALGHDATVSWQLARGCRSCCSMVVTRDPCAARLRETRSSAALAAPGLSGRTIKVDPAGRVFARACHSALSGSSEAGTMARLSR